MDRAAGHDAGSVTFNVQWDTTHFKTASAAGQAETIEVDGDAFVENLNANPPVYALIPVTVTVSVKVYNLSFAGEDLWITMGHPTAFMVDASLADAKYYHTLVQGQPGAGGWTGGATRANCLPPVGTSTVYYFDGDGYSSPSEFGDPGNKPGDTNTWEILSSDVLSKRQAAPPLPPVSFAMLDACYTGANNSMAAAFLCPTALGLAVDQAEMGWRITSWDNWCPLFSGQLFDDLDAGWTVGDAMDNAWKYLQDNDQGDQNLPPRGAEGTSLAIYGDDLTTIHGLYLGGEGDWYSVTVLGPPQGG